MSVVQRTVFKFGGAALADGPGVGRVVSIVADRSNPLIIVVSAHSGVTAVLRELAEDAVHGRADVAKVRIRHRSLCTQLGLESELLDRYWVELAQLLAGIADRGSLSAQDRDAVLSIGERVSARIVARSLRARGVFATPVDAFDLGFVAEDEEGRVRPRADSGANVRLALEGVPGVPVVTGFLARTESGLLTTLGPNGSDWTASWLAEAVQATELVFWKTVPGIMTADPHLVPKARVIERLPYADAFELARHGAEVLHPNSIEPARRANVHVTIRDVLNPAGAGTELVELAPSSEPVGITTTRENGPLMRIAVVGGASFTERAVRVLRDEGIESAPHATERACLVVDERDLARGVLALHRELFERDSTLNLLELDA